MTRPNVFYECQQVNMFKLFSNSCSPLLGIILIECTLQDVFIKSIRVLLSIPSKQVSVCTVTGLSIVLRLINFLLNRIFIDHLHC